MWETGDPAFYELNDMLQYLGFFAFRAPVPAYKHSAAMFLRLRGWIGCNATHPLSPTRPESDREILKAIAAQLDVLAPNEPSQGATAHDRPDHARATKRSDCADR